MTGLPNWPQVMVQYKGHDVIAGAHHNQSKHQQDKKWDLLVEWKAVVFDFIKAINV